MEAVSIIALILGHNLITEQIADMSISERVVHRNGYQVGLTPEYQRLLDAQTGIRRRVLSELETLLAQGDSMVESTESNGRKG